MNYKEQALQKIDTKLLSKNCFDRVSDPVKEIQKKEYVIDVHTHLFDIKCINKSYFIIRMLKDLLGLKSASENYTNLSIEQAYSETNQYNENWEVVFEEELHANVRNIKNQDTKGIIDIIHAAKFLGFSKMEQVYDHYINRFSLAQALKLEKEDVLITALMMDLEIGWECSIKKKFHLQIDELKKLAKSKPILPFLFCDPRRAELTGANDNLYSLFNMAFCEENPFFGVKIYPALGYDPSDYRLWPIYEICEEFNIPVLSHCGGESISSSNLNIKIFEGEKEVVLNCKNRRELAYTLNDPKRWELVLKMFPKLKLNLAHFGGYETWESSAPVNLLKDPQQRKEYIFTLMENYENVYADFSYNLVEINLSKNLKQVLFSKEKIRSKTLFGSDYWVVNKEGNLLSEQERFLKELDNNPQKHNFTKLLTFDNPKKYLFG